VEKKLYSSTKDKIIQDAMIVLSAADKDGGAYVDEDRKILRKFFCAEYHAFGYWQFRVSGRITFPLNHYPGIGMPIYPFFLPSISST